MQRALVLAAGLGAASSLSLGALNPGTAVSWRSTGISIAPCWCTSDIGSHPLPRSRWMRTKGMVATLGDASPPAYDAAEIRKGLGTCHLTDCSEFYYNADGQQVIPLSGIDICDGIAEVEGAPYLLAQSDVPVEIWCDGSYSRQTGYGGASAVIPGDANSGLWKLSVHIDHRAAYEVLIDGEPHPVAGSGMKSSTCEWIAVEMGLAAVSRTVPILGAGGYMMRRPVRVFTDAKYIADSFNGTDIRKRGPWGRGRHMESVLWSCHHLESREKRWREEDERSKRPVTQSSTRRRRRRRKEPRAVSIEWVKSHSGVELNERADALANAERDPAGKSKAAGRFYFG